MEPVGEPRTVVFDLGEVLASPTDLYAQLGETLGSDAATVERRYWTGRDAHDRGSSVDDYWGEIVRQSGLPQAPGALIRRLSEADAIAWTTLREDAVALLRDLDAGGVRVAILSNAPLPIAQVARTRSWASYVDAWFFSADLGIAKPDDEIYAAVAQRLEVSPYEIIFFDDRLPNVEAACNAGWRAYLWTSDESTREILTGLGILKAG